MRTILAILILLFVPTFARAQETPIPPTPTRWVTDTANFMSAEATSKLDAQLEAYEKATRHQLIVYIGKTTGGVPIEDWAVRAFEAWKVGRKGIDDGLVLFIMADDRKLRIEVGYGLEAQVPDAIAFRIIDQIMVPKIRAGDRDGAVNTGVDALVSVISGQGLDKYPELRIEQPPDQQPIPKWQLVIFGIIGFFFLIFLITHPSLAIWLLINILSSGRGSSHRGGGWGGGGFGGFSGGGGRSGGGGASGSW